jgi:hypothetical protein
MLIDDYTHYTWTFPLRQKSQVLGVDAKRAPDAKHTASRTKLASHAQRVKDVPVIFFLKINKRQSS